MKKLLLLVLLLSCFASYAQTQLYVDSSLSASGSGASWTTAYKTLNEALNVANSGSTTVKYVINIAKGSYYPTGAQSGVNRDSTFLIGRGGIQLLGGYPTGGGTRSPATNTTLLSGNIGSAASNADNSYHIIVASNIAATGDSVIIDGLRLSGGSANGTSSKSFNTKSVFRYSGAAVYNTTVSVKMLFTGCSFSDNTANNFGGAIYNENSSIYLYGCSFSGNTAPGSVGAGGAIYWLNTGITAGIAGCSFSGNSALTQGGAVYCSNDAGGGVIRTSSFSGNTAATGGAIYITRATPSPLRNSIDSCSFSGNSATGLSNGTGGAINDNNTATTTTSITNNTFSGNSAQLTGGALNCSISNNLSPYYVRRCVFTGNVSAGSGGGLYYSCAGLTASSIDSCRFVNNKAGGSGGGLYASLATVTSSLGKVTYCSFIGDTALGAGGGAGSTGTMVYSNCNFSGNKATIGGGLYLSNTGAAGVKNDTIQGNIATLNGGGLYAISTHPTCTISNSLFAGNKAGTSGGAVYDSSAYSTISNSTFAGDTAANGNGIYNNTSNPTIQNCIVWEGSAGSIFNVSNSAPAITYSTIEGGYSGTGNSAVDPRFVSPVSSSAAPTTTGNYKLLPCSPVIEKGNPTGNYTGVLDLAGNARLYGTIVDHGAYEYQGSYPLAGPSTVCMSNTAQFTNVTSGGTWSNSNTSVGTINSSGVFTAVGTGVDTVKYTVTGSSSCAGTTTRVVTVLPLPTVAPITGRDSVCTNTGIIYLNNVTSGGVWSSSDTNKAKVSTNGTVTGRAVSGLDTIFYAYTGTNGCTGVVYKVITVIASPAPGPISGGSAVCKGSSLQLSNTVTGGTWFSSNASIASINQTGKVQGNNLGTVTIEYRVYNSLGCFSAVTIQLSVVDKPSVSPITGPDSVCLKGGNIQLVDTSDGGNGAWRSANTAIATISSTGVVTPVSGGRVFMSYTVTNSTGCTDSAVKAVNIKAMDKTVSQTGTLLSANLGGAQYQWLDCGNGHAPISGQTAKSFTAPGPGIYAVEITYQGCTDTSACLTVGNVGVGTINGETFEIYPNPANSVVHVRTGKVLPDCYIVVKDITGRELQRVKQVSAGTVIDVSGFTPGAYLVEIVSEGVRRMERIVVGR